MASPRASSPGMGKLFKVDLSGPRIYSCAKCRCHLAKSEDIISKVREGARILMVARCTIFVVSLVRAARRRACAA